MPRNASGTYSLPTGNPVVSGTVIQSTWANDTMSDIGSALTDSLSRSGEGGMTASLRVVDGTVSTPGLAFANETGSGLYRTGAGAYSMGVLGNPVFGLTSAGASVTGTLGVSSNATVTGTLTVNGQTITAENSTAYYPQIVSRNKTADANSGYLVMEKDRAGNIVQNGDVLGNLVFRGYDGASYLQGAYINALVSAAPGSNDMPTDLAFGTTPDGSAGPSERMRITQAGSVGIGTSSPASRFDVTNSGADSTLSLTVSGVQRWQFKTLSASGDLSFFNQTANAERMRITSSGNLLVGTTGANNGRLNVVPSDSAGYCITATIQSNGQVGFYGSYAAATGNAYYGYWRYNGTVVGAITSTGTTTTYATSSDYRLKENIQPMQNALAVVQQLNPVTYKWKADGSDGQGFIAHELQAVVPDCVTGEKDATRIEKVEVTPAVAATFDEDGNELTPAVEAVFEEREVPVYQGIDTSFLVATLTKAIQELAAKVATLESAAK